MISLSSLTGKLTWSLLLYRSFWSSLHFILYKIYFFSYLFHFITALYNVILILNKHFNPLFYATLYSLSKHFNPLFYDTIYSLSKPLLQLPKANWRVEPIPIHVRVPKLKYWGISCLSPYDIAGIPRNHRDSQAKRGPTFGGHCPKQNINGLRIHRTFCNHLIKM